MRQPLWFCHRQVSTNNSFWRLNIFKFTILVFQTRFQGRIGIPERKVGASDPLGDEESVAGSARLIRGETTRLSYTSAARAAMRCSDQRANAYVSRHPERRPQSEP